MNKYHVLLFLSSWSPPPICIRGAIFTFLLTSVILVWHEYTMICCAYNVTNMCHVLGFSMKPLTKRILWQMCSLILYKYIIEPIIFFYRVPSMSSSLVSFSGFLIVSIWIISESYDEFFSRCLLHISSDARKLHMYSQAPFLGSSPIWGLFSILTTDLGDSSCIQSKSYLLFL